MYIIDKKANRISKLDKKSFKDLGFGERKHLQEWVANNPESLGEEILIIQKEFSGFNDTNERLDLLGVDKQGNLVIIENKLDDTGRDVTWQVLKYASYCSTLKKEHIRKIYQEYLDKKHVDEKADDNLAEFFNVTDFTEVSLNSGQTQRIILVAANYRKEVTSTVLWLLNYKLRIQCFKATPYQLGDQLFLDIEQIIPMKDAEDYVISMADKTQEDINTQEEVKSRHVIRIDFWKELLKQMNAKTNSFQNISPTKDNWISIGSGLSGASINLVISNYYARVEFYISRQSKDENKLIFDELFKRKIDIEEKTGIKFVWERLDSKKASRIKCEINDVSYFDNKDWNEMILFLTDTVVKLEKVFKDNISEIRKKLKSKE